MQMEHVLDLGCNNGHFMLADAMNNPERIYFGIDNRKPQFCTDTSKGVYNLMQDYALRYAHNNHNKPSAPDASIQLMNTIFFSKVYAPYDVFLACLMPVICTHPKGKLILDTKVSDVLTPDDWYFPLIKPAPEIFDMVLSEFFTSEMPEAFAAHASQYCSRINFLKADARNLPFKRKSFDYVTAIALPLRDEQFLEEAKRVTTEDGLVLITLNPYPELKK